MHQIFWCCAGVLAQDSATQVLSISSYRPFVLLPAAHLVDLPVHKGLQPTHFSTGFSWNTMKCCYQFPKSQLMWCRRLLAHSKSKEGSQLHPKQRKDRSKRGNVYHLSPYTEKQHLFCQ